MPTRPINKIKFGGALGAAVILSFPVAAQASTTPTPVPVPSALTSPTQAVSAALPAPLATAIAPKATTSGTTTTVTTPAPAGTADAYAAQIAGVAAISHTHASASGGGTSSTANPLELGGSPPAAQFGGSKTGPGTASSALLDTGPSSQFRLALTPWAVSNSESGGQNSASAIADIVLLDLGDQTTAQSASVRVLQSTSDATWNSQASSGNSSSDGAIIKAGGPSGLAIDLLHAETSSNGTGNSYLLSINGNEIGTSGQVNGQCTLAIPGLLSLNCLTASGGVANSVTSETAGVLSVVVGSAPAGLSIGAIQSTSSAGTAGLPTVSSGGGSPQQGAPQGQQAPAASSSSAAAGSGSLPFTGFNTAGMLFAGLLLGLVGWCLVWATRRKRARTAWS